MRDKQLPPHERRGSTAHWFTHLQTRVIRVIGVKILPRTVWPTGIFLTRVIIATISQTTDSLALLVGAKKVVTTRSPGPHTKSQKQVTSTILQSATPTGHFIHISTQPRHLREISRAIIRTPRQS